MKKLLLMTICIVFCYHISAQVIKQIYSNNGMEQQYINLMKKFYSAFEKLDAESMAECYHKEVKFEDPAFGILEGERASNMWRMLCGSLKDQESKIQYCDIQSKNNTGSAHWEANYTFSATGRKVYNVIDAEFKFKDGKIIEHTDCFDLYNWSKQALGVSGYLIGWTKFFKKKLNQQTNKLLSDFEQKGK